MLILSRRIGERIMIGPDITVTVIDIDRNKVRVGISCPRETPVYREELLLPDGTLPPSLADHRAAATDPDFAPDMGGEGGGA